MAKVTDAWVLKILDKLKDPHYAVAHLEEVLELLKESAEYQFQLRLYRTRISELESRLVALGEDIGSEGALP